MPLRVPLWDRWSSDRKWTIAIVGLAIALRIVAALVWQYQCQQTGSTLRFGDSNSYWTIARNLVVNGEYQYGSAESKIFRAPIYPLFLAVFAFCEHYTTGQQAQVAFVLAARIAGCLLGGLTVWMIMRWTSELADPVAGRIAGVLAACYCGAVGMSIFVLSEAVATPLFVASVWFLWRSTSKQQANAIASHGWIAASAVMLALACLARPSWGLWPAIAVPYLFIASKQQGGPFFRRWMCQVGIFFLILCLVMSPWWVRNYWVTGKFVPTTLQVGASLYDGWHAGASGSSDENMAFSMETMHRIVQEESVLAKDQESDLPTESTLEWRIDRRLRQEAVRWAYENPSAALGLGLIKFWRTWSPIPRAQELSNPWIHWWEAGSYLLILSMSFAGMYRMRVDRRGWISAISMALPCIYLSVLHMVFIGSVRYRQPGVLILCGLGAIGIEFVLGNGPLNSGRTQDRDSKDAIGSSSEPER